MYAPHNYLRLVRFTARQKPVFYSRFICKELSALAWKMNYMNTLGQRFLSSDANQGTEKKATLVKHENIYTLPNYLTLSRIVLSPLVGYLIVKQQSSWAIGLFGYCCVTDFVDGYLARKWNMKSAFGSIIDPMADKLMMTICTLSLCYAGHVPTYLASLIIVRDLLLSLMAIYYRYVTLDSPKTFKRYADISIPSATVRPNTISKVNTFFQMIYLGVLVLQPGIEGVLTEESLIRNFHLFLKGMEVVVASTTFISGCTYLFSKDAIRVIDRRS